MARRALPLALAICSIHVVMADDIDKVWTSWLTSPPYEAVQTATKLAIRADHLAANLSDGVLNITGSVDVVVSGGGNLDAYFLGGYMLLNRLETDGKISMSRFAGASAGGMMPFELLLKGENSTLIEHLSYGFLEQTFPTHFSNMVNAAATQDHHWRIMTKWMVNTFSGGLSSLDDRVFLALSCLDPLPKLVVVSNFTSKDQAEHAFMATGTFFEEYDGMPCSDGGAMSGPRMTPLFQDHARKQIIVDLMRTGRPTNQVSIMHNAGTGFFLCYIRYCMMICVIHYYHAPLHFRFLELFAVPIYQASQINMTQYATLVQQGQDEMAKFLQSGTCRENAISLCPANADVRSQVCKKR